MHCGFRMRVCKSSLKFSTYVASQNFSPTIAICKSSYCENYDVLIVPFYKSKIDTFSEQLSAINSKLLPSHVSAQVNDFVKDIKFDGTKGSKVVMKQQTQDRPKYIALVGMGEDYKSLAKSVLDINKDLKCSSVGIISPFKSCEHLDNFILSLNDESYDDKRFKKLNLMTPENPKANISIIGCDFSAASSPNYLSRHGAMSAGVHLARDLVGAPANSKTPLLISQVAKAMANEFNMQCTVLGQAECEALGMGAYLAVQQGSKFPPQFVHMVYKPVASSGSGSVSTVVHKVALVGKGLTFDSGGYNLKTGGGSMIELMKFDMGGCAAVLGCARAIAEIRPNNVEVHFITAVCENMISAEAMRPGDIVTASNGKTIEIGNTDAEGRLTLADALVYSEKLNVDTIIDCATLTGACVVALGEGVAGLYASTDKLAAELSTAAEQAHEPVWRLPLVKEYHEQIKSPIADLRNIGGGKGGGSITAALFLQEFVEKTNWAHIGPVWDTAKNKPTGFGVKLLVNYITNLSAQN